MLKKGINCVENLFKRVVFIAFCSSDVKFSVPPPLPKIESALDEINHGHASGP